MLALRSPEKRPSRSSFLRAGGCGKLSPHKQKPGRAAPADNGAVRPYSAQVRKTGPRVSERSSYRRGKTSKPRLALVVDRRAQHALGD